MPNWVYNIIKVYCKDDDNSKVVDFLKQHINEYGIFDFNTVVPEPETQSECPDKYNFNKQKGRYSKDKTTLENPPEREWFNWYDWRVDNWGTKWNSGEEQCIDYDKVMEKCSVFNPVKIQFSTAWSSPFLVFKKLYEMHPELSIHVIYYSSENGEYGELYSWNDKINHIRWELDNYSESYL